MSYLSFLITVSGAIRMEGEYGRLGEGCVWDFWKFERLSGLIHYLMCFN